jgi:hypothetical protein
VIPFKKAGIARLSLYIRRTKYYTQMKSSHLRVFLFTALLSLSIGSYAFLASSDPVAGETMDGATLEEQKGAEIGLPDLTLMRKFYQWTKELIYMI